MANHIGEYEDKDLVKINGKPVIILGGDKGGSVQLKEFYIAELYYIHKEHSALHGLGVLAFVL